MWSIDHGESLCFFVFFSYLEIFFIFKTKINIEFLLFGCESKINFL